MGSLTDLLQPDVAAGWLLLPSALVLGVLQGLEPGHSKTMMTALIIAIRSTVAQAVLLGLESTPSHTSVIEKGDLQKTDKQCSLCDPVPDAPPIHCLSHDHSPILVIKTLKQCAGSCPTKVSHRQNPATRLWRPRQRELRPLGAEPAAWYEFCAGAEQAPRKTASCRSSAPLSM